jgi:hypothetical protein
MARKGSRTDIRQNSYSVRIVEKLNSHPGEMKSLENTDAFRRALRRRTQLERWLEVGTYQKCENLLEKWQEKSNNRPVGCLDF